MLAIDSSGAMSGFGNTRGISDKRVAIVTVSADGILKIDYKEGDGADQKAASARRHRLGICAAGDDNRVRAACRTGRLYNQAPDGPETGVDWTIWLVFDEVGVRQFDGRDTDVGDRSKTLGLTFPHKLDGTYAEPRNARFTLGLTLSP